MNDFKCSVAFNKEQAFVLMQALELYEEIREINGQHKSAKTAKEIWELVFDAGIKANLHLDKEARSLLP
jgi:hypothetical protein